MSSSFLMNCELQVVMFLKKENKTNFPRHSTIFHQPGHSVLFCFPTHCITPGRAVKGPKMETFIKSSLARRAAATSAQGSVAASASVNADSAKNSSGASTNLAEISQTLDTLLNKLTESGTSLSPTGILDSLVNQLHLTLQLSERLSIGEENVAKRLQRLCEQYPQSHIPTHLPEWQRHSSCLHVIYPGLLSF